jgi:Coenzyme PQQ synthesis protein D (PqqD)
MSARVHFRINSPKVIHQIFDTEVVIVNLETGNYYSLRGAGIDIWRYLEAGRSCDQIMAAFDSDTGRTEKIDILLHQLETEQLIAATENMTAEAAATPPKSPFVDPTFEKFSDMRDLLLLDPIHELDESGWPKNRPPLAEEK